LFGEGREVEGELEEVIASYSFPPFLLVEEVVASFWLEWLDSKRIPMRPLEL